jgi:hypothetical protein
LGVGGLKEAVNVDGETKGSRSIGSEAFMYNHSKV